MRRTPVGDHIVGDYKHAVPDEAKDAIDEFSWAALHLEGIQQDFADRVQLLRAMRSALTREQRQFIVKARRSKTAARSDACCE
jgi:hypothetical protein